MEFYNFKMAKDTKDNGFKIKKMVQEYILGQMEVYIKEFM